MSSKWARCFCTQLEVCIYIKLAYISRFDEPAERSEWGGLARTLSFEMSARPATIITFFRNCQLGELNPEKQKPGAGHVAKQPATKAF